MGAPRPLALPVSVRLDSQSRLLTESGEFHVTDCSIHLVHVDEVYPVYSCFECLPYTTEGPGYRLAFRPAPRHFRETIVEHEVFNHYGLPEQ